MGDVIRMSERQRGWVCAVEFDCTDDEATAFVRGWEAGQLYARLSTGQHDTFSGTYHASNAEMLRRVAKATAYDVTLDESPDPAWVYAEFRRPA